MKKIVGLILALLLLSGSAWGAATPQDKNIAATLGDLRQDVKNKFLVMTDALFPDSILDDFINAGCRDLAGYGIIEDVDTIVWVANTKYYALPVNFRTFIAIYPDAYSGVQAFDFIHPSAVGKIAAATDLTASRYVWTTGKNSVKDTTMRIWFYPAPSAVDTMELIYGAEAIRLSASSDTTNIPYHYVPLISMYAAAECYAKAQEYSKASWWFALYDQMLNKKLLFDQKRYDYIIIPREIKK